MQSKTGLPVAGPFHELSRRRPTLPSRSAGQQYRLVGEGFPINDIGTGRPSRGRPEAAPTKTVFGSKIRLGEMGTRHGEWPLRYSRRKNLNGMFQVLGDRYQGRRARQPTGRPLEAETRSLLRA